MAGDLCPYCGTLLTTSLKFCVNCRRSVTEDKIRQAAGRGAPSKFNDEDENADSKFRLSRKGGSIDLMRQTRTFFLTATSLLTIFLAYYFTMKFVIHQPVPFEPEMSALIQSFVNSAQPQPGAQPGAQ